MKSWSERYGPWALVTGASSGIGRALAQRLAAGGARLILVARREPELVALLRELPGETEHSVRPFDLLESGGLKTWVQGLDDEHDGIDVLINNAGVSQRSLALDTAPQVLRRLLELNFFAPVLLTQALAPRMVQRRRGHIAVVSSVMGKFATPNRSGYAASKHALHGYFDALRAELHGTGVRITLACPGYVHTNVSRNALTGDGSALGYTRENTRKGLSARGCAGRILSAMERGRNEVVIGGAKETAATWLKRLTPDLLARVVARVTD